MSPHVFICLAAVLFAGMVQVKASDANDCYNQQSLAAIFNDPTYITDECEAFLSAAAEPASPIDGAFDFSDLAVNFEPFKKK